MKVFPAGNFKLGEFESVTDWITELRPLPRNGTLKHVIMTLSDINRDLAMLQLPDPDEPDLGDDQDDEDLAPPPPPTQSSTSHARSRPRPINVDAPPATQTSSKGSRKKEKGGSVEVEPTDEFVPFEPAVSDLHFVRSYISDIPPE